MYLARLKLLHFKNFSNLEIATWSEGLNVLVGANGMGKTNLLDAVYYACMGKSYFGLSDQFVVQQAAPYFRLEADFVVGKGKTEQLVAKVEPRKKKVLECNAIPYEKLANHVGRYPVVITVPDDTQLVTEGSEERRRLLDNTLSQLDAVYLDQLLRYNAVLHQRNALLKQHGQAAPTALLEVYDQQLAQPAAYIYQARQDFITRFQPALVEAHQAINNGAEEVGMTYQSALEDGNLAALLLQHRTKDLLLQRTTVGIHRDELTMTLQGQPLKRMGSQGQIKSFALALKLAQFRFLQMASGKTPLLLLDDIFDKLDPQRVRQLLDFLQRSNFGQVFLSDTDPRRAAALLDNSPWAAAIFDVTSGQITPHEQP